MSQQPNAPSSSSALTRTSSNPKTKLSSSSSQFESFPSQAISSLRKGTIDGVTINSLCNIMGAGTLALPFAFHNASIITALVLLVWVGALSYHAVHALTVGCDATGKYSYTECVVFNLLPPTVAEKEAILAAERASSQANKRNDRMLSSSDSSSPPTQKSKKGTQNSPNTILTSSTCRGGGGDPLLQDNKWRKALTILIELVIVLSGCGTLIVYTRVIGEMVPAIFLAAGIGDLTPPAVNPETGELPSLMHRFLVGIADWIFSWVAPAILFFFLSCAQHMEKLKWASIIGFGTIFYIVVIVVGYYFKSAIEHSTITVGSGVRWIGCDWGIFGAVSTFAIAFRYHFNVPYFYGELQQRFPDRMLKTVSISTGSSTILYVLTGLCGYLLFGMSVEGNETIEGDVNITTITSTTTFPSSANRLASHSKAGHGHAHAGGNVIDNFGEDDMLANIGRFGLLIHFIMSYPIISVCTRRGLHRLYLLCRVYVPSDIVTKRRRAGGNNDRYPTTGAHSSSWMAAIASRDGLCRRTFAKLIDRYEATVGSGGAVRRNVSPQEAEANDDNSEINLENRSDAAVFATVVDMPNDSNKPQANQQSPSIDSQDLSEVHHDEEVPTRFAIRVEAAILVAVTSLVAHSVHGIGGIMELFGALFGVPTVMILPGLVGLRVFHQRNAGQWWLSHAIDETSSAVPTSPTHHSAAIFSSTMAPHTPVVTSSSANQLSFENFSILLRGGVHSQRQKIALLRLFSWVLVVFGCLSFIFGLCT